MKQCPKCKSTVIDTAKFCTKCGFNIRKHEEDLERLCPECGTKLSGADFCPECGTPVTEKAKDVVNTPGYSCLSVTNTPYNPEAESEKLKKALSVFEYDEHSDGTYTITALKDKGLMIINVPKGVISIEDSVFEGTEVAIVTLPDKLLKIGNRAFADCRLLTKINIPESLLVIGDEAFSGCIILDVEIPKTVKMLGTDAISGTVTEAKQEKQAEEEAKKADEKRKAEALKNCYPGTIVEFGNYLQESYEQKTPIKWKVLDNDGNKALLLSEFALDCQQYHAVNENITWEQCTLRKWMNDCFLKTAFTSHEQSRIPEVTVPADKHPSYSSNPGNAVKDKAFILGYNEAIKYGISVCKPTKYAVTRNAYRDTSDQNTYYWLRSPGNYQSYATEIHHNGSNGVIGVTAADCSVRPAIWINLQTEEEQNS